MQAVTLQSDSDLLDSVCIADAGMCECLSFTGQLSHILLADAAAVYSFANVMSSPEAKTAVSSARRVVFFVSWLSFECKNAMRAIMSEARACEDVCVYSTVLLRDRDPIMSGLDFTCRYVPYPGRAFELQDAELVLFPAAARCVGTALLGGGREETAELLAAQLAEVCVSRRWKPQFRAVNDFCHEVVLAARARIEEHGDSSSAPGSDEDQHSFVVVMDRLADIRSAVRPPDCVLQRAMDQVGECSKSIRPSLEQMLMWSKGSETLQAIANGMDALLERRLEDAERELADMDAQNSFASTSVREAAQSILGTARESSQQMDSPIRHTITTMIKIAQESGQEEEVYQQLLELNMQPKCDPLTLLEAACTMAYCMRERFRPGQDFLNAFERRLEGTTLAFDHFWSTVQYCCNARSRAPETCDVSQPLISALLEKAIKEDDPMNSMQISNSGSLGSFVTGVLSGLTRGLADWKPSQCSVICLVVFGGITPDEIRCVKQFGSKLCDQTLVVVSNSVTSRTFLYEEMYK